MSWSKKPYLTSSIHVSDPISTGYKPQYFSNLGTLSDCLQGFQKDDGGWDPTAINC
jgi:hypothetical protein